MHVVPFDQLVPAYLVTDRTGRLLEAILACPLVPDHARQGLPREQVPCQGVSVHDERGSLSGDQADLVGAGCSQIPQQP